MLVFFILAGTFAFPLSGPAPAQTVGDFVKVQGEQLVFRGKPIKLRGANFYPKDYAWARMWSHWNGPAARSDLAKAQEIGINSIRVMVPYKSQTGWTSRNSGHVKPQYLNRLQQLVQIAGELNMKVIITLFDFYDPADDDPTPGSEAHARNLRYLEGIVPAFANDDRVLAWDLHNEPDQYTTWKANRDPAALIAWLDRMAAEVRRLDPNHPITVGMSDFQNLFVADQSGAPPLGTRPRGRTVADISDFLSFHSYNAGNMDWQIHYIKEQSDKPVLLQEMGWPTGPPCQTPEYADGHQVFLYDLMLKAARKADIAGVLQWQLWDLTPGASIGDGRETHEEYFGLLRRDGTWKPATTLFRDAWPGAESRAPVVPLPSVTTSQLELTAEPPPPPPSNPDYQPPLYFPETGHYAHGVFRDYWRRFGGLEVFGYPLTEQRKEGDYWVQYFERARFEFHPEYEKKIPGFLELERPAKLRFWVQLTRLGVDLVDKRTGGKGYPRVDPSQVPPGATYFPETGHTISGKIAEYWWSHNGITNFGYPLSEQIQEVSQADGKTYTVQYFERTRLEHHPEHAGTRFEIQLGLMGRELLASKGCR